MTLSDMSATKEELRFSHNVFKNDPLLYKSYVGNEVNVTTETGEICSGIVYTVDPVSESVVLIQLGEKMRLKLILGHAIKNVEVTKKCDLELPELFMNLQLKKMSRSTIEERKRTVKELFAKNRLQVKENKDVLTVENVATINPPYEPENCMSSNSIVLARIQALLSQIQT